MTVLRRALRLLWRHAGTKVSLGSESDRVLHAARQEEVPRETSGFDSGKWNSSFLYRF
jgi:hypothetical protein